LAGEVRGGGGNPREGGYEKCGLMRGRRARKCQHVRNMEEWIKVGLLSRSDRLPRHIGRI